MPPGTSPSRNKRCSLQPHRPRLCAFWLTVLVEALRTATTLRAASLPLRHLTAYLWRFTAAAVPLSLLPRLLAAATAAAVKRQR